MRQREEKRANPPETAIARGKKRRYVNGLAPQVRFLGVRPEDIADPEMRGVGSVQAADCIIDIVEPTGADTFVVMQLGGKSVTARLHSETTARPGKTQRLAFDLGKVSYFAPDTGLRLN